MILALRPRIVAALLGLVACLPASLIAGMTQQEVKEFQDFKAKAEKGDEGAQFSLAVCYYDGRGVAKDRVEAVKWYRKAAEQGNASAQNNLGICYATGQGVDADRVEASKWLRKAAEQGNADAQFMLGLYYLGGFGVPKDEIEAYAYFNLSGITLEHAREMLAILEKQISPDARLLGQHRAKQLKKEIEGRLESAEEIRKAIEKERSKKGA